MKENADNFSTYISEFIHEYMRNWESPSVLKHANITPVFKKGSRRSKETYHCLSILPVVSKIFENLISKQLTTFIDPLLSSYQCRFQVPQIPYKQGRKSGNYLWIKKMYLVSYWLTFLKLSIFYPMNWLWQY